MKFDVMTGGLPLRSMAAFARDARRAGFSGIVVTEGGRTAYLGCGAAALAADIDILTGPTEELADGLARARSALRRQPSRRSA